MLKSELIDKLASNTKLTHLSMDDVDYQVNLLVDTMSGTLIQGNRIEIRDFGSFSLHYHPPRRAHNPRTRQHLITPEKYRPHFKPGKKLKEDVNASEEKE